MERRHNPACLDRYALKTIADQLRGLYTADATVPDYFVELLKRSGIEGATAAHLNEKLPRDTRS